MALRKFLNNLFLQWCLKQTHLAPVLPAMNLGKVYSPASTTCCCHLEMSPVQPPSFTSCPVGNKPTCPLPEPGHGQSSQSDLNYRSALLSLPTCLCLDLFLPDFRKKVGFYEKVEVFLWLKIPGYGGVSMTWVNMLMLRHQKNPSKTIKAGKFKSDNFL